MATLAFFAIGAAIGGGLAGGAAAGAATAVAFGLTGAQIGGFIGGAIGSYVDSVYLMPLLRGGNSIEGQKIGDQPVMTGQEGSPMHWVLGPLTRVGGTAIWKSPIIEEKSTRKVGKGGGTRVSNYEYFVDLAIGVCDTTDLPGTAIGRVVKVYADTKLIYDGATDFSEKYDSLTVYDGSQTTTDPLIVSYEGEEATPVFKKLCYIVINRLALADFGNRVPNISAVVEQDNPFTLQEGVSIIMQRAGYATSEFDVTRLDQCLNGYVVSGPQEMHNAISPLSIGFNLNIMERDGVITFLPKGAEDQMTVESADDLAAHEPGSDAARPFDTYDMDDFKLPSEVTVTFTDALRDLEGGSQTQHRWDHVSRNRNSLNLPITMTPEEALNIAKRFLWSAESERQRVALTLPPKYLALREGMSLVVPVGERTRQVWVRRVNLGANYMLEVEGTFMDADTYDQESTLDEVAADDGPYEAPETIGVIADLPTMSVEEEDRIGLYYAACAEDPLAAWRGAQLWSSADDVTYAQQKTIAAESVVGLTRYGLLRGDVAAGRWDRASALTVEVFEGGLESAGSYEVLSGANRAAVLTNTGEYEIIGFQTATLIDTRTYTLTNLLRGLRGTGHLIGKHTKFNQRFILGEVASVGFIERSFGDNSYWKFPALGGAVSAYDPTQVQVAGRTLRPFSPIAIAGSFDPSTNDLTLTWSRRMKYMRGLFAAKPLPADEDPESYEVDLIIGNDPEFGTVVRTIGVTGTTLVYPDADQTADGFAGIPVAVSIHQISTVVGRSPYGFAIIRR